MAKIKNLETLKISNFFKQNRFSKICKCSKTSQFSKFLISVKGLNWKPVNIQIFQLSQIKQILWNMRVLKKISSFLSVTFQYKGQSKKLRNLGKFQLLQIKQIWNLQVLKTSVLILVWEPALKTWKLWNFQLSLVKHVFWNVKSWKNFCIYGVFDFSIRVLINNVETSELSNFLFTSHFLLFNVLALLCWHKCVVFIISNLLEQDIVFKPSSLNIIWYFQ